MEHTIREQKIITSIQLGIVNQQVAWVFHYASGRQESFALHLGVARQFMQGLQELVLLLEQQRPPHDQVGVDDTVRMRLTPPRED